MPLPNPHLTVTVDRVDSVVKSIRDLANVRVMVGIPSDEDTHYGGSGTETRRPAAGGLVPTIGNATLGYIHENGSPIKNIPPRPFLAPGVRESKDRWLDYLNQAGRLALIGNFSASQRALHAAGMTAVSAVKSRIVAGIPPPLKQSTVDARRKRSRGSSYRRRARQASDTTPLVDTGQLLNSISYVIRKVGGK